MELLADPVVWCVVLSLLGAVALEAAKIWGGRLLWFMGFAALAGVLVFLLTTGGA